MGVLSGYRVIELAGIGPGPMCAMLLSDMGADVLRIDRMADAGLGIAMDQKYSLLNRGRRSVAFDLKKPEAIEAVLKLVEKADALIEGFRPGVTERLGLGPDHCLKRNPRLIYGRMTGWGQDGPLAHAAGHDINYIALSGALHSFGRKGDAPVPPLNLVGDFGGGALYLALGVVAGLLEAQKSGKGQVVDAAMVDGAASLMTAIYGMHGSGFWNNERGDNILDTGAHYYEVYETKDNKYVAIGSIEAKFYAELLEKSGLKGEKLPHQQDRSQWPAMKERSEDDLPHQDARRVVQDHGGQRYLLRARAQHGRGAEASAQSASRNFHRGRRRDAAGTGAAILAHAEQDSAPAGQARRAYRGSIARLGLHQLRLGDAAQMRRDQLGV